MNLHGIASGAVGAINPQIMCVLRVSAGYNTAPDGRQTPNYGPAATVPVQVQALTYTDLMKLGGLNIEGTRRACYLNGTWEGVDRAAIKGGDLLTMPDLPSFPGPTAWLVAQVLEYWPDWSKLAITLQAGS